MPTVVGRGWLVSVLANFCVNLMQTRVIWEEETSIEKLPPSHWPRSQQVAESSYCLMIDVGLFPFCILVHDNANDGPPSCVPAT